MTIRRKGVLFIGHTATRTGAPIALLHFLRWYKENGTRPAALLLDMVGELVADYREAVDTWPASLSRWCPGGMRSQGLRLLGLGAWAGRMERIDLRRFAERCSPGLVYVNSATSDGARLVELLRLDMPVLMHVHELEFLLRIQAGVAPVSDILKGASQFIACSEAVKRNLVDVHGIPTEKVETVHETIAVREVRPGRTRDKVLRDLAIPPDAALVVGGGAYIWRKGADLFLQVARIVSQRRPNAYFIWVGGLGFDVIQLEHDIQRSGLSEKVRLTGLVTNPADFFAAADVFVLPSREDPYPLVCLEAAAAGKPIICFAGSGGMPEFVENDCGFVVPYLDVDAMVQRVLLLLDSEECRSKMGKAAQQKVRARHDIGTAAPKIAEIIERTIAGQ